MSNTLDQAFFAFVEPISQVPEELERALAVADE
jgi:hypothetical protein